MMYLSKIIGKRYGNIVIKEMAKYRNTILNVLVECDCGKRFVAVLENVERGKVRSCGCMKDPASPVFLENVKKRIESLIEVVGDCWVWKGKHRNNGYDTCYMNACGIQINPVKFFAEDDWLTPTRNVIYVRQCDTPLCVNPAHYVRVSRSNLKKAQKKEIECEYLRRQRH